MTNDAQLVLDILDSVDAIMEFTAEGREAFLKDRRTQYAVIRAFEVVGEAAKRVSPEFREANPQIPWSMMARTRDKLIHDYPGVDAKVVWRAVERDLPELRAKLRRLVP